MTSMTLGCLFTASSLPSAATPASPTAPPAAPAIVFRNPLRLTGKPDMSVWQCSIDWVGGGVAGQRRTLLLGAEDQCSVQGTDE